MVRGKPVTCIIPVRGGSRGIPGKNMRTLGGMTLLERAIRFAGAAPAIDRTVVTTDDPEMFALAETFGVAAPSLRPASLATGTATTIDVVEHLISQAGIEPGYLLLLQVTTPLRTRADLGDLLSQFENAPEYAAAASVCVHEGAHPEKLQRIEDKRLVSYLGREAGRARQLMPTLYELNGAFYLIDRDILVAEKSFLPDGTMAFVMPPERSANLDTMTDWNVLNAMIACGHWPLEEPEG